MAQKLENLIDKDLLANYDEELKKTYLAGGIVFDISAHKATGSPATPATFASLTAALGTNGANIPQNMRKGGMTVKFIKGSAQSQSNKYVQYRLTTQTFSTSEADWECIEDSVSALEQIVGTGGSVDERIAAEGARHYLKAETYTKTEVNGLVDTPHQEYVTVEHYADLPATGSADTIYRVPNWDGSANSGQGAVDATVYSEYAWDDVSSPNKYVFLCVKSLIGEVFDISVYNNNAVYADLAAALGTNGANVPESLRKGGMSVKFIQGSVQSSDNKYVQYRLMSDTFNTTPANWQGVDDEPTAGSDNLVKSGGVYKKIFGDGYPKTIVEITVRPEFESGAIDDKTGVETVNNDRRRTGAISVSGLVKVGLIDYTKFNYWIRVFDNSGFIGSIQASAMSVDKTVSDILSHFPIATYIRLVAKRAPQVPASEWSTFEDNGFYYVKKEAVVSNISIWKYIKRQNTSETKEQRINIEYGGLDNNGKIESVSDRVTFFNKFRTSKFIKDIDFGLSLTNCSAYVYKYDADFNYIGKVSVTNSYTSENDCAYIKLSGTITDTTIPHSVKLYAGEIDEIFNNRISDDPISFVYEVTPANGRDVMTDDTTINQYDSTKYYNSGILKLPSSYRETGTPTRLIFWAHGSGDYGRIETNNFGTRYSSYIEYLQKEGYAIFDCFGGSSKYMSLSWLEAMGSPTNMSCINAAYKWIVKNYNICTDGIYVSGKSLGGIICGNMLYNNSIPVLAVCPLAPMLDMRSIYFGYNADSRTIYCQDMGFVNYSSITDSTFDSKTDSEKRTLCGAVIAENIDKLIAYNGVLRGVIEDKATIATMSALDNNYASLKKMCNVPIKIFIAPDDSYVNYNASKNFIAAIKNLGGDAELRTMPSGTGGHNAVDTGENALRVTSITTKLGYVCTNIPLAWVEMVQFFRRY